MGQSEDGVSPSKGYTVVDGNVTTATSIYWFVIPSRARMFERYRARIVRSSCRGELVRYRYIAPICLDPSPARTLDLSQLAPPEPDPMPFLYLLVLVSRYKILSMDALSAPQPYLQQVKSTSGHTRVRR